MNASLLTTPRLLVLFALLAPLCLLAPAAQVAPIPPVTQGASALRPGDIVAFEGSFSSVNFGQQFTAYTVPMDKWLVITDYDIGFSAGTDFDLYERDSFGSMTPKRAMFSGAGFESSVGLAFRPGSQVVLQHMGSNGTVFYAAMGYLANP